MSLPTLLTWSPTRGWSVESPSPSSWPAPVALWSSPPLSGEGCPAHAPPCDARHHGDRHWDSLQVGTPGISIQDFCIFWIKSLLCMICFISALLWSRVYFSELVHRTGEGAADCAARWQIFSTQQTKKPIKGSKSQIKCQDCNYQPVFICWSTPPGRQHLSQHQGPHHGGRPTSGGDQGLSYPLSFLCFEPVLNHEISDWHNFISPFLHFDILLFWIYPIPHTLTIFAKAKVFEYLMASVLHKFGFAWRNGTWK